MTGPWGWNGMMRGHGFVGAEFLALLLCLAFLAFAALVVWLIVRSARSGATGPVELPPRQAPPPDPVLETLRRRLAEGAITAEEFDQLREKLGV